MSEANNPLGTPIDPNLSAEAQSTSNEADVETPKPVNKLKYDPANMPAPINGYEQFIHALLVEARLIRQVLTKISDTLATTPTDDSKAEKTAKK